MRAQEFITELKSPGEVQELESQLDHMFSSLGLDVEFSRHFVERLLGREKKVTVDEIRSAFEKLKKKYKGKLLKAKKQDMGRAVLQDFDSDLNVMFAITPDRSNDGYDLVNITVKRKDPMAFHTSTPSGSATPYQVGSKKVAEAFLSEGDKLEKHEMGMGMTSYQNDEVLLAGGMRSGNSDAKHTRLKFMVYDLRGISSPEEFREQEAEREVGYVELFVVDATGEVDGLVNINLKPKARGTGIGRAIISSLVATFRPLKIFDIKRSAIPFWRKMGATFYTDQHFQNVATNTAKAARFGLYAILESSTSGSDHNKAIQIIRDEDYVDMKTEYGMEFVIDHARKYYPGYVATIRDLMK